MSRMLEIRADNLLPDDLIRHKGSFRCTRVDVTTDSVQAEGVFIVDGHAVSPATLCLKPGDHVLVILPETTSASARQTLDKAA